MSIVEPGKTYRYIRRTPKGLDRCVAGTTGLDMGVSRDLSRYLPIRSQEMADAVLAWIRLYEPKAPWKLEEV